MTDPTPAPVLTLRLTPEAVDALAFACTWYRGELWKYLTEHHPAPSVRLLYDDVRLTRGDQGMRALIQQHHDKLAALGPRLDHAFEQLGAGAA